MAPLKLSLDGLKDEMAINPDLGEKAVPNGFDPCQWKAFQVLEEFLQPKSTLLLGDAVNRIIAAFPESSWFLTTINQIFIELAEQIPYNHQSQRKLATLVCVFGRGIGMRPIERTDEKKDFASLLTEYRTEMRDDLTNYQVLPNNDEGEPLRYVNFQAFLANLDASGLWYYSPVHIYLEIRYALEMEHLKATQAEEEAFVMGAAQWILWNGQGLVRHMIWHAFVGMSDKTVPIARMSDKQLNKNFEITPIKWHLWRDKFKQVAADPKSGKECREVAAKAADMMDVLERNMPL